MAAISSSIATATRQIFNVSGDPVVVTSGDFDGDGLDELVLIVEEGKDFQLQVLAPSNRKDAASAWEIVFNHDLEDVRRKPSAIRLLDCFDGERPGIIVYIPREAPVLLGPEPSDDGLSFRPVAVESTVRESLFKAIQPLEMISSTQTP